MTLTPEDHTKLTSYTLLPTLTPDQAHHVKRCMPANCWLDPHKIRWWYPVDDKGFPIHPQALRYDQPVRAAKVLPPKIIRQVDPLSLTSTQPWLAEGISRATWYQRKGRAPLLAPYLIQLPRWVSEAEGLKLHAGLSAFAHAHSLDFGGLWCGVCDTLERMREQDGKGV